MQFNVGDAVKIDIPHFKEYLKKAKVGVGAHNEDAAYYNEWEKDMRINEKAGTVVEPYGDNSDYSTYVQLDKDITFYRLFNFCLIPITALVKKEIESILGD